MSPNLGLAPVLLQVSKVICVRDGFRSGTGNGTGTGTRTGIETGNGTETNLYYTLKYRSLGTVHEGVALFANLKYCCN